MNGDVSESWTSVNTLYHDAFKVRNIFRNSVDSQKERRNKKITSMLHRAATTKSKEEKESILKSIDEGEVQGGIIPDEKKTLRLLFYGRRLR